MKGVYRTASILVVVGCTALLRGQSDPPADNPRLRNDRELAKLTALKDYMTVIGALERLAAAKDYGFLCELLPSASENARSTLIGHLYSAPDDVNIVSIALYNYMAESGDAVVNSNGENLSAIQETAERTIDRLSRVFGLTAVEVDFGSTDSVRRYIEKIRPLMEKLQASTPGSPPLAKPPPPPNAIGEPSLPPNATSIPAPHPDPSSTASSKPMPTVPTDDTNIATEVSLGTLVAWVAVGVAAIGLLLLILRRLLPQK